jgi:hypothetical protein
MSSSGKAQHAQIENSYRADQQRQADKMHVHYEGPPPLAGGHQFGDPAWSRLKRAHHPENSRGAGYFFRPGNNFGVTYIAAGGPHPGHQ